jgi:hypothetical protein
MDPLQTGVLVTTFLDSGDAFSALPDAPIVPAADRSPVAARTRGALSGALHRLADAVAPAAPARPARRIRLGADSLARWGR